jgi:hypothetical protein
MFKKLAVAAAVSGAEEYLAAGLAKDRNKQGRFFTHRILNYAVFGSLVYLPFNYWLLKATQYLFCGHTGPVARFFGILFGLLVVSADARRE